MEGNKREKRRGRMKARTRVRERRRSERQTQINSQFSAIKRICFEAKVKTLRKVKAWHVRNGNMDVSRKKEIQEDLR